MKKAQHIINSFLSDPFYALLSRKVRTRKSLEKLKSVLPLDMRNHLMLISYRAPKILFCFDHPSYAQEFNNYKKKDIMYCLSAYKDEFAEFLTPDVEVRAYVPSRILAHIKEKDEVAESTPSYKEHSNGEFVNHASDPLIHEQFEKIRGLIIEIIDDENA